MLPYNLLEFMGILAYVEALSEKDLAKLMGMMKDSMPCQSVTTFRLRFSFKKLKEKNNGDEKLQQQILSMTPLRRGTWLVISMKTYFLF